MNNSTKETIAQCFINLVCESSNPYERISVTKLVKALDIDRKTFYNNFDNTSDLVIWIYRSSIAERLKKPKFYQGELVYPNKEIHDKYEDLPCYTRFVGPDKTINERYFFKEMCECFNSNEEYYKRMFSYPCYLDFYQYLEMLYMPIIYDDVLIMLDGQTIPEECIQFLAEYHTIGLFGRIPYHYSHRKQPLPVENLDDVWNYAHDAIRLTIDAKIKSTQK